MGPDAPGPDSSRIGTNHFAWEMTSFEDLQAMSRHLKAKGVEILRTRENTHAVGVYCNDPDGNGIEVYYEEPGGYRRAREGSMPGSWKRLLPRTSVQYDPFPPGRGRWG